MEINVLASMVQKEGDLFKEAGMPIYYEPFNKHERMRICSNGAVYKDGVLVSSTFEEDFENRPVSYK